MGYTLVLSCLLQKKTKEPKFIRPSETEFYNLTSELNKKVRGIMRNHKPSSVEVLSTEGPKSKN